MNVNNWRLYASTMRVKDMIGGILLYASNRRLRGTQAPQRGHINDRKSIISVFGRRLSLCLLLH